MDALKRVLADSRRAEEGWVEYLRAGRNRPSPIEAYFEAIFYMFPINVLRGTPEAADFYRVVNEEVRTRIQEGNYPLPEETFRVLVEGVPPYTNYRTFWDFFRKWGAVSVVATYPKVGGLFDRGFFHDPSRPLESIAEYSMGAYVNQSWPLRRQIISDYLTEYSADAAIIHGIKSCRSFTAGQGDLRDWLIHEKGVPTLYIESDHQDPRYFAPAQIKNRMDAFFESLEQRRAVAAPGKVPGMIPEMVQDIKGRDAHRGSRVVDPIVAGMDIGSTTAKCVVLQGDEILGKSLEPGRRRHRQGRREGARGGARGRPSRAVGRVVRHRHRLRPVQGLLRPAGRDRDLLPRPGGPLPLSRHPGRRRHRRAGHQGDPDQRQGRGRRLLHERQVRRRDRVASWRSARTPSATTSARSGRSPSRRSGRSG